MALSGRRNITEIQILNVNYLTFRRPAREYNSFLRLMNAEKFNQSNFSRWINSETGRVFRIIAGVLFLLAGIMNYRSMWGIVSIIWSFFPLSAGVLDICYISVALGGPLSGSKIRARQSKQGMNSVE